MTSLDLILPIAEAMGFMVAWIIQPYFISPFLPFDDSTIAYYGGDDKNWQRKVLILFFAKLLKTEVLFHVL